MRCQPSRAIVLLTVFLLPIGHDKAFAQMAVANCLEEEPHIGLGQSTTIDKANSEALANCVKNGGDSKCCTIYASIYRGPTTGKITCLGAAQGYNGDFGYGFGPTQDSAIQAAISNCKVGAVAPNFCGSRQKVSVCQKNPP